MTDHQPNLEPVRLLLNQEVRVINLGLELFAETFASQQVPFVHVDWRPPAEGDDDMADILSALRGSN